MGWFDDFSAATPDDQSDASDQLHQYDFAPPADTVAQRSLQQAAQFAHGLAGGVYNGWVGAPAALAMHPVGTARATYDALKQAAADPIGTAQSVASGMYQQATSGPEGAGEVASMLVPGPHLGAATDALNIVRKSVNPADRAAYLLRDAQEAGGSMGPQTVANAQRNAYPGIYQNPRYIVANADVAPEDPLLKQLFGVSRGDLAQIAQREGNLPGDLPGAAAKPKGSAAATAVMTPANTQRVTDILSEADKRTDLAQGMKGWYVMDPLYQKFVGAYGADAAPAAYRQFNAMTGMASPGSDVLTEINRGTAARMYANQGNFGQFVDQGGGGLAGVRGHPYHSTAQAIPMGQYLDSGEVQMKSPKVPMYIQASGVPETGFQTRTPVGDAHWSRGVGLADTRTSQGFAASVSNPEMSQLAPWWRGISSDVGMQSVPAQALLWGTLGKATGVDTAVGSPKLELIAQSIGRAAGIRGVDPEDLLNSIIRASDFATY